jgi:hypothetical protein
MGEAGIEEEDDVKVLEEAEGETVEGKGRGSGWVEEEGGRKEDVRGRSSFFCSRVRVSRLCESPYAASSTFRVTRRFWTE